MLMLICVDVDAADDIDVEFDADVNVGAIQDIGVHNDADVVDEHVGVDADDMFMLMLMSC